MSEEDFSFRRQSIFCSVRANKMTEKEQFVPAHVLIHVLSGWLSVVEADSRNTFEKGQTLFVRRSTLAKFTKYPEESGEPFKTLSIFIRKTFLQDHLKKEGIAYDPPADHAGACCRVKKLPPSALLDNLFESLRLYFDSGMTLGRELSDIKTREAVWLIRQLDLPLYESLFHFTDPGKIDLEDFMSKNFVFNVSLTTFSRMTGRSLSTFKRDFKKVFDEPPSRWLKKKRLEHAYYLIKEKHKAPSDVYLEVGFENLSHFSSSFKEVYGRNPSALNDPHSKAILACAR
ncbi:MAG: helix-turn-helix transcriptional regulator [Deltaproteobacteria bacterium]|nr:helix-turn-helix transcriptional regulator [Deltaproteobacteria bacterium]